MTLFDFIKSNRGRTRLRTNGYMEEFGFEFLYVRIGPRYNNEGEKVECLDIANIKAYLPGDGCFTRLIDSIQLNFPNLWIYVENVHNPRFHGRLLTLGFVREKNDTGVPSYFLEPMGARTLLIERMRLK